MHPWIARRTTTFDSSGVRRIFDLAANLSDPINLSIGQPDFDVPESIQEATIDAIRTGKNGYSPTQGIGPLQDALRDDIARRFSHDDREVFVSTGTSGGLVLAMLSMVDPGDEVIFLDPYFVMYPALVRLCGGVPVAVDSYPDFELRADRIADAITPKTKMILLNNPANPTGMTASRDQIRAVAELAAEREIALVSDEIYSRYMFDEPFVSPASFNDRTIVIDGFSKSHAMTGWRIGYVHGPSEIIRTMMKVQQYSFVCAPQPAQWGAVRAMEVDLHGHIDAYRQKRDRLVAGLEGCYELTKPGGAFYLFPKAPIESGTEFVERAIANNLLVIPGKIFSSRDSHFRISFAVPDETLDRGIEALRALARHVTTHRG